MPSPKTRSRRWCSATRNSEHGWHRARGSWSCRAVDARGGCLARVSTPLRPRAEPWCSCRLRSGRCCSTSRSRSPCARCGAMVSPPHSGCLGRSASSRAAARALAACARLCFDLARRGRPGGRRHRRDLLRRARVGARTTPSRRPGLAVYTAALVAVRPAASAKRGATSASSTDFVALSTSAAPPCGNGLAQADPRDFVALSHQHPRRRKRRPVLRRELDRFQSETGREESLARRRDGRSRGGR